MAGIVITPVVSTFVMTLPLMEPIRPLEKMATLAAPPRTPPSNANAKSRKNFPPPVCCKATPKIRKPMTNSAKARIGMPSMLSMLMVW
jgi:hypothetical protein